MLILPGHLAYFFVLSIVPIITIIFFIATSFHLPLDTILNFIKDNFSTDILKLLTPIITESSLSIEFVIFLCVTIFIASNGANSIIIASNEVYNIPDSNWFKRRIKSIVIIFLIIILFTFILVVPLFGESILKGLSSLGINNNLITGFRTIYPILNLPLSLLVIFFFIKLVFTIAPDENIPSRYVNKGALFTTVSWVLITACYSFYINNFTSFSKFYAGLSTVVIIMLYFYIMSVVLVIGLVLNHRNMEIQIEKTNALKLDELSKKVHENTLKQTSEINLNELREIIEEKPNI